MDSVTLFTKVLSYATLLGNIATVLVLFSHVFAKEFFRKAMHFLADNALRIGFVVSFFGTFGSLAYAEVTGYPACILCWTQRIFMYPLVFLFALALWRKDKSVIPYALLLAVLGGLVALYNWVKDMLALYTHIAIACPVVPGLPSCDRIYVDDFGYITIAMYALNAFILIILPLYASLRLNKQNA